MVDAAAERVRAGRFDKLLTNLIYHKHDMLSGVRSSCLTLEVIAKVVHEYPQFLPVLDVLVDYRLGSYLYKDHESWV